MPRYEKNCPHCGMPAMALTGFSAEPKTFVITCVRCSARFLIETGAVAAKVLPVEAKPGFIRNPRPKKKTLEVQAAMAVAKEQRRREAVKPNPPPPPQGVALLMLPMHPDGPRIRVEKLPILNPRIFFIAADRDGRVFGYEYEPDQCDGFWGAGKPQGIKAPLVGYCEPLPALYVDPFCLWWRRSLLYRNGRRPTKLHGSEVDEEPKWQQNVDPDKVHRQMRTRRALDTGDFEEEQNED